MSSRPSSYKKGGGFLNNVDVTISGYEFIAGETAPIKKGSRKGELFTPLWIVPSFLEDGADEPQTQRLLIGDAARFGEISGDGLTLNTTDGSISQRSEAGVFIYSLIQGGFPETSLSDDDTILNFEPVIGARGRLKQVRDPEKTARQGKRQGKDGKEYDQTVLQVDTVLDLPSTRGRVSKEAVKLGSKESNKDASVATAATTALIGYLEETKTHTLPKSKLRIRVMTDARFKDNIEYRSKVAAWLSESDNLDNIDGISTDGTHIKLDDPNLE